jgi:hypothetical protein
VQPTFYARYPYINSLPTCKALFDAETGAVAEIKTLSAEMRRKDAVDSGGRLVSAAVLAPNLANAKGRLNVVQEVIAERNCDRAFYERPLPSLAPDQPKR